MTQQEEMKFQIEWIKRELEILQEEDEKAYKMMKEKYDESDYRLGNYYEGMKTAFDFAISLMKIALGQ